jgi:hypothetical protein
MPQKYTLYRHILENKIINLEKEAYICIVLSKVAP